ncbi:alpha/beta hydrolase [Stenotrophomonas sp. 24(2023)]|uniref:alpha/beta hydrolase n=1 Tax=Stenotrophomonas sp. 24(2023) TaxID=3068324 RepID=UPI0027E1251F|nr:alpha/beta hydrolase [Stenotrophomonas sp. 24(2023)]WMJ70025.1 alpha/beta hydrolase [Stenotrophomonas sp. 24(2023)]
MHRPGRVVSLVLLALLSLQAARAAPVTWHPPEGTTEIPLWPEGKVMPPPKLAGPEQLGEAVSKPSGERWAMLQNVAVPTLTLFPPKGPGNGTAVMVVPGGGYRVLAMDLEGSEICAWLNGRGITCALLKYRVPASGPNWDPQCNCRDIPAVPMALQDAQRAMGLLRAQSARWHIDPKRVGVIGFSAGGHVVAGLSTQARRSYTPVDAADAQPSRPDFAMVMYSGHLWNGKAKGLSLVKDIAVDGEVPPTFIVQATDDPTDDVRESLSYYRALIDAGVPVEMHLFARGGHAFGLRVKTAPVAAWPQLAERWMQDIGMLSRR